VFLRFPNLRGTIDDDRTGNIAIGIEDYEDIAFGLFSCIVDSSGFRKHAIIVSAYDNLGFWQFVFPILPKPIPSNRTPIVWAINSKRNQERNSSAV
jgi:hypothetical protein